MEEHVILNELAKIQDLMITFSELFKALENDIKLILLFIRKNSKTKTGLSFALENALSDEDLDKLEVEELAAAKEELNKFNCTYPQIDKMMS